MNEEHLIKLKQQAESLHLACNLKDSKLIEQAVGSIYAVSAKMAENQEISWTAVCDCACHEHDKEEE